jgi:hypothetical protein
MNAIQNEPIQIRVDDMNEGIKLSNTLPKRYDEAMKMLTTKKTVLYSTGTSLNPRLRM